MTRFIGQFAALSTLIFVLILGGCNRADKAETSDPRQDVNVEVRQTETPAETPVQSSDDAQQEKRRLAYLGWEIDEGSTDPRICFSFYTPLNRDDNIRIRDYIRVEPETNIAADISGNDLCVSGFNFDRDYQVTLLQGLPGRAGRALPRDFEETISFGDKPQYVAFAGDGIILPRVGAQGLAIETVNVEALTVEIARVNDRMIARRTPQAGRATLEGDYSWEYDDAAKNIREVIWSGEVDVKNERNKTVTTVLGLSDLVGELSAGAYVVTAERKHGEDENRVARAWRWIISTDMALTAYHGDGGMDVSVRSIDSAKLMDNVEVVLVAENNDILARQTTDSLGHVRFGGPLLNGKGPKRARMLMAYGDKGDYTVLDLQRAPLDLSQYEISGRKVDGAVDAYGFTERGVYRPGETAHFTVMLRDVLAKSIKGRAVDLIVKRPNGIEMHTERVSESDLSKTAGTVTWSYEIPAAAPRGVWSLAVKADGEGQVARVEFSVEDFVPQKLKVGLDIDGTPMTSGEARDLVIQSDFLYGAPGAGLEGEADARLKIDPNPFPDFSKYAFGPAEKDFEERFVEVGAGITDGRGELSLSLDLSGENVARPWPLRADITAGVAEPGGRYVLESTRVPVRALETYVGIKPNYEGYRAPRGKPVELSLIALDRLGERVSRNVTWTLIEEDWDYHWYRENGTWRYRRDVRDIPVTTGTVEIAEDKPLIWARSMSWGNYRLDVDAGNGAESSYRFSVGWGSAERSDTPDQLQMGTDQISVKAGEAVTLNVSAPYAGQAELVIANDRVRMVRPLTLSEGGSEISFKFAPEWGDSVYALMTLYTPRDIDDRPVPRRAVGISYVKLDRSSQTLNLEIEAPDVVRPRQAQMFTVKVGNVPSGEKVWMNFAAVDEGILRITKYKSPDAAKHYFGRKALGVDVRDDYGRILNANLGDPAIARSGGDSLGGEGLTVVPTKTVALFSGPVSVKNGKADVTLKLPDFNGELRLMATAWSKSALGSGSDSVKVRDQVPALFALPRFLAPGDRAEATLSLDNVEGGAGVYTAAAKMNGANLDGATEYDLEAGQRLDKRIGVSSDELGESEISLQITGPGGYETVSTYPIQTRTPYMPITKAENRLIEPGEDMTLSSSLVAGFVSGSTDITVSFSRLPGLDPAPYVQSLARYPYGCTEQTVSTAMPLLYADNLGGIPGQTENQRRRGLQKAISRLSNRQSLDGAFGLWREGDKNASPWLGVYATDFMYRAKEEGLEVSPDVLARATKAISELSRMPRYPNLQYDFGDRGDRGERIKAEAAAYAHYVLAREGEGKLGQMRYLFDNHKDTIKSPLAHAYLAGALSMMGDNRRAERAQAMALRGIGYDDERDYYQSPIRDVAGVIAATAEAGLDDVAVNLAPNFREQILDENWLHTQEKAYVILALKSLLEDAEKPKLSATNVELSTKGNRPSASLYGTNLSDNISFTSRDDKAFWATITVSGSPDKAPLPSAKGFVVTKSVFTDDGKPLGDRTINQGEKFVVKIAFNSTINQNRTIVLADLLPAGFEIETILKPEDGSRRDGIQGAFDWVGNISSFDISEARDDRFVASLETYRKDKYIAAYLVRAVTPGEFAMPGVVVEDMYRPEDMAVTESSRITISADSSL